MDVIAGKTDEINQQEHHRKTKIYLTVTLQIEPHPECNGNRYPTEIEYPGKEIGNRTMVQSKILTRDKDSTVYRQAKKGFFCLIKSFYINGIHLVIGIYAHPVIRNAEYEKRQQRHCQLTGCLSGKEQYQKYTRHQEMFRTKPDTDRCQNQEKRCDDNHQHRLSHRGKQTIFHSLSFSSL